MTRLQRHGQAKLEERSARLAELVRLRAPWPVVANELCLVTRALAASKEPSLCTSEELCFRALEAHRLRVCEECGDATAAPGAWVCPACDAATREIPDGGTPARRCDQCGADQAEWQDRDAWACPNSANPYASCDGKLTEVPHV